MRLGLERDSRALGPGCNLVDVLRRRHEHAHPDTLLPVTPLLPIILAQTELVLAGASSLRAVSAVFPPLIDGEAERFVESDALLQIVHGEHKNDGADLQSFLSCGHVL